MFAKELVKLKIDYNPWAETIKGKQILFAKMAQIVDVKDMSNPLITKPTKTIDRVGYRKTDRFTKILFEKICVGFDEVIKKAPEEHLSNFKGPIEDYDRWKASMKIVFLNQEKLQKEYEEYDQEPITKKAVKKQSPITSSQPLLITEDGPMLLQKLQGSIWVDLETFVHKEFDNILPIFEFKDFIKTNVIKTIWSFDDKQWEGEATYYSKDRLLSILLFFEGKDQIRLNLSMDDNIDKITFCIGHYFFISRNYQSATTRLIVLKRIGDNGTYDKKVVVKNLLTMNEITTVCRRLISTRITSPFIKGVHDYNSLINYLESNSPKNKHAGNINGNFLLFYIVNNKVVRVATFQIYSDVQNLPFGLHLMSEFSNPYPLKDKDHPSDYPTLKGHYLSGSLNQYDTHIYGQLFDVSINLNDRVGIPSAIIAINNPDLVIDTDILTGYIFGNLVEEDKIISSFFFAMRLDENEIPLPNKDTITKILTEHRAGDTIKRSKLSKGQDSSVSKMFGEFNTMLELKEFYGFSKGVKRADFRVFAKGWRIDNDDRNQKDEIN